MALNKATFRNLTLLLGSTTTILAAVMLAPSLPGMALEFGDFPNAEFLVRLSLTMPALLIALGAPFAGVLLDRWGRKPVIVVALLIYGFSGAAGLVLNSLAGILLSRALLGIAVAGLASGFTALIADNFSGPRLNQFMGFQAAAIGIAGVVVQFLAGVLAAVNWRYPFAIYLLAFLVLPGAILSLDGPRLPSAPDHPATQGADPTFPAKTLAAIYLVAFVGMLTFFVFPVQLPFFLTAETGANSTQIGLALSLQTLTSVFAALSYQRIKARFSFLGIFGLVFLTLGINHLIAAISTQYVPIVLGLLVGGLGIGLLPPNLNVWVSAASPPAHRGRAFGGLTTAIFAGQFLTPIFTQPIVTGASFAGVFALAASTSALLGIGFAVLAVKRR